MRLWILRIVESRLKTFKIVANSSEVLQGHGKCQFVQVFKNMRWKTLKHFYFRNPNSMKIDSVSGIQVNNYFWYAVFWTVRFEPTSTTRSKWFFFNKSIIKMTVTKYLRNILCPIPKYKKNCYVIMDQCIYLYCSTEWNLWYILYGTKNELLFTGFDTWL